MTDQPEQPRGKRPRRRAASPSGHSAVVPASVGQGAQIDASAAAKPTKRRARKRDRDVGAQTATGSLPAATAGITAASVTEASAADAVMPDVATAELAAAQVIQADSRDQGESADIAIEPAQRGAEPDALEQIATEPAMAEQIEPRRNEPIIEPINEPINEPIPVEALAPVAAAPIASEPVALTFETTSAHPGAGQASFTEAASVEDLGDHGDDDTTGTQPEGAPDDDHSAERSAQRPGEGPPREPPAGPAVDARHHRWVYATVALFLLSLAFGLWGVWTTFFAGAGDSGEDPASLRLRNERLSQEISTLRRSDQISRDANRDLQRTLAERDEEIAGLRADVAFYERFVGATGQRRGLSVHDLDMQLENGRAWRFVATLTQNLNRGAVNDGRLTIAVEGTRNGRLERLSWTQLRQQNNAPGLAYSFKYFQQVEGNLILPEGFEPLRVTVRLVPAGGSAVEQSFPWADTVAADTASANRAG